jgi:tol-pal system protein YbgF
MKPRASLGYASVFLFVGSAGCAHGEGIADKQIAELREDLVKVQAERDRYEQRVNQLELAAQGRGDGSGGPVGAGTPPVATPNLKVVHLAPGGADSPDSTAAGAADEPDGDDGTPRPTIRIVGNGADPRGKHQTGLTVTDDQQQQRPSAADPDAKRAYDHALQLLGQRKFNEALEAFAAFLVKWPDHPYADNATYWRGEAYFAQSDFAHAAEQFEGVVVRFPQGNKVPDALLKLGICQQKLNNPEKAKSYFDKLVREFPKSEAARRIPQGGNVQVRPEEKKQ